MKKENVYLVVVLKKGFDFNKELAEYYACNSIETIEGAYTNKKEAIGNAERWKYLKPYNLYAVLVLNGTWHKGLIHEFDNPPASIINKNPLSIRYSSEKNWVGQVGENNGLCVFDTLEHGFHAALTLLCDYYREGYDTARKIIMHVKADKNTIENYISKVKIHFHPDEKLETLTNLGELARLLGAYDIGEKSIFYFSDQCEAVEKAIENFKYPELK